MRTSLAIVGCLGIVVVIFGCGDAMESSNPASTTESAAEVPQAGPAATETEVAEPELGPAPPGQTEPPLPDTAGLATDEPAQNEPPTADTTEVSLSIMSWDEAQEIVKSKAGQIVVLDVWSTSCVPCRREFPYLVELHQNHADQVACMSFSMDYSGRASKPPESYREKVTEFLQEQGATFDNILGNDDPDALYERLQLASIPAVYVYDREGTLLKRFDNEDPDAEEFTYEANVLPFVNELLAQD